MGTAKASKEPSMEEILASIRQIIADDDRLAAPAQQEAGAEAEPEAKVPDQDAIDSMFDSVGDDDSTEMAVDDIDALFDEPEEAAAEVEAAPAEAEVSADDDDDDDDDVLALTPDQTIESPSSEPDVDDISFSGVTDETPDEIDVVLTSSEPAEEEMPSADMSLEDSPPLVSSMTQSTVKSAFGNLQSAMTVSNAKTVEGLMQEMMRPMLKQWLDENLPQVVERLVQSEIERMRG